MPVLALGKTAPRRRDARKLTWCCKVLLVLVPGEAGASCMDQAGLQALSLLRQLGMPSLIGIASGACPDQAANAAARMKEKAAARKRAAAVLASEVTHQCWNRPYCLLDTS